MKEKLIMKNVNSDKSKKRSIYVRIGFYYSLK